MKYVLATIVAFLLYSLVAFGIGFGAAFLWFNLTQSKIEPLLKAEYLSGLLHSAVIMAAASAIAAVVAGNVFSRMAKAERLLPGVFLSSVLAIGVALEQKSPALSIGFGVLVLASALIGAWLGLMKAPNNSLKADGTDVPPP